MDLGNEGRENLANFMESLETVEITRRLKGFKIPMIWNDQQLIVDRIILDNRNYTVPRGEEGMFYVNTYIPRVVFKYYDPNPPFDEIPPELVLHKIRPKLYFFVRAKILLRTAIDFRKLDQYFRAPSMEGEDCPVCYETLTNVNTYKLNWCGHSLCTECAPDVINTHGRCPMCRSAPVSQKRISRGKRKSKRKSNRKLKRKKMSRKR